MSAAETTTDERFRSLEEMRDAHHNLLKQNRVAPTGSALNAGIARFVEWGRATGVILDADEDRTTAQSMLDYWSTIAMRNAFEAGDANLESFAPGIEGHLTDNDYPYQSGGEKTEKPNVLTFGTERLTKECLGKLRSRKFVAITGGTGSGRSTMVRRSLLPEIESGRLGEGKWIPYLINNPGCQPLRALLAALCPSEVDDTWIEEQSREMRRDPSHLAHLLDARNDESAVIVFDSFEQIFTDCEDVTERGTLSASLLGVIKEATGGHVIILLIRSDFISHMNRLESLELEFDQSQVVVAFTTSELRQAIEEPAKRIGLRFEEGLVDRLLLDLQGDPAAVGLLGFTMFQLWQLRTGCWITWDAYRKVGGGGIALQRCAEAVYERFDDAEKQACKAVFLKLFRPEVGFQVSSVSASEKELLKAVSDELPLDSVLSRLLDARLIRVSGSEATQDLQYAATHEALSRHWIQLVEWLEEERVAKRRFRHLSQSAQVWAKKKRESALLWQGSMLRDGLELLNQEETGELEHQFLRASKRHESMKQVARLTAAILVLTGLVAAYASYRHVLKGIEQEKELAAQAQRDFESERGFAAAEQVKFLILKDELVPLGNQESAAVKAADLSLNTQDVARAMLWNIEAAKRGNETRDKFNETDEVTRKIRFHVENTERIRREFPQFLIRNPDQGDSEVGSGFDRYLNEFQNRKKDVSDQKFHQRRMAIGIRQMPKLLGMAYHVRMLQAELSPNGSLLATVGGSRSTELFLWGTDDLNENRADKPLYRFDDLDGAINNLAWNADGTRLGVALDKKDGKQSVRILRVQAGEEPKLDETTFDHEGPVIRLLFAGDGNAERLITVSRNEDEANRQSDEQPETNSLNEASVSNAQQSSGVPPDSADILTFWSLSEPENPLSTAMLDGQIKSIEVCADRALVITAASSKDGKSSAAQLWNPGNGSLRQSFSLKPPLAGDIDHKSLQRQSVTRSLEQFRQIAPIDYACLSPDNTLLAAISDKKLLVWKVGSSLATEPVTIVHDEKVTSAEFSPNPESKVIATTGLKTVMLWSLESDNSAGNDALSYRALPGNIENMIEIYRPAFSPDGLYLATPGRDQNAGVWEVATGRLALPLLPHGGTVSRVWFAPDGQRLFTQRKNLVRIWSLASENPPARSFSSTQSLHGRIFGLDGTRVITASGFSPNDVSVWNTASGERVSLLPHDANVVYASLSPDNKYVVTASADRIARVWDSETGKLRWMFPHADNIVFAQFNDSGDHLVTVSPSASTSTSEIRIWQIADDHQQRTALLATSPEAADSVRVDFDVSQVFLDSDGQRLVAIGANFFANRTGKKSGRIMIRRESGEPETFEAAEAFLHVAVIGRGERTRIAAGSASDQAIVWWRSNQKWRYRVFKGHQVDVSHVAFSPNGRWLITSGRDKDARIWDLNLAISDNATEDFSESLVLPHDSGMVNAAAFSPDDDGKFVITAGADGMTRVWETKSGKPVGLFPSGGNVISTQFVLDTTKQRVVVVSGSEHRTVNGGFVRIRNWGWEEQEQLMSLEKLEHDLALYAGQEWIDGSLSGRSAESVWAQFEGQPLRLVSNHVLSSHSQLVNDCLAAGQPWAAKWHAEAITRQTRNESLLLTIARVSGKFWDPDSFIRSAQKNEELDRWTEASDDYAAAVELRKDDPKSWEARGRYFDRQGDWKAAVRDYSQAIALSRNSPDWRIRELLGAANVNLLQWDAAAQAFNSALEIARSSANQSELDGLQLQALHAEAWGHIVKLEWPEAVAKYDAALTLDPARRDLLEERAAALVRNRDWDRAIAFYADQIREEPNDDRHYWRMAVLQLKMAREEQTYPNDYEQTRVQMLNLFENTRSPRAANNVAWTCALAPAGEVSENDTKTAVELAKLAVEESAKTSQSYLNTLGATFYRDGQFDEAIGWLNEARRTGWVSDSITKRYDRSMSGTLPDDAGTVWEWLFLAMASHKRDAPADAEKWLRRVIEWREQILANQSDPLSGWENDLELEILFEEASRLIEQGEDVE